MAVITVNVTSKNQSSFLMAAILTTDNLGMNLCKSWSDGRADDCTCLESRRVARHRGFESLSLRLTETNEFPENAE